EKKYVKAERENDRTDGTGRFRRLFRFALFGHRDLCRSLRKIFVERSFGKRGFGLEFGFGGKLFLGLQVVLKDLCRKIQCLYTKRERLDKRRSAAKYGQVQPLIFIAPFRQRFGGRDD